MDRLLDEGQARWNSGDAAGAEQCYRQAIAAEPGNVVAWHLLGSQLSVAGRNEEAARAHGEAARLEPSSPVHATNLGNALALLGRIDEAEGCYRRAIALQPDLVESRRNLGNILRSAGRVDEALTELQAALALQPESTRVANSLGKTLQAAGRFDDAGELFRSQAARAGVDRAEALNNLGVHLYECGRFEAAADQFAAAAAAKPTLAPAQAYLGMSLAMLGRLDEAIQALQSAVQLDPNNPIAFKGLGFALLHLRRFEECEMALRCAVRLAPRVADHYRNLSCLDLYRPGRDLMQRFQVHRELINALSAPVTETTFSNDHDPDRRLRIGYLSSDLRWHSVSRSLIPLLEGHDRGRVSLHLYSCGGAVDDMTARIRSLAQVYRTLTYLSDEQAAASIRADKVDVLVFVASQFDANRPLIAAYGAAPVQLSWGNGATTGLDAMEYLITDSVMVPRLSLERFSERVVRMPYCYLHGRLVDGPAAAAQAPQHIRGRPTFGCFNNPAKISDQVLQLWVGVLSAVPDSRLLLKYQGMYRSAGLIGPIRERFAAGGIDPQRVEVIEEGQSFGAHLSAYDEIDVALDTLPFSGSTTTFEALWMGVPVVTWPQDTMVSRSSASMLTAVGLDAHIASSAADYVQIATRLARDPRLLDQLRRELRARLEASCLVNGPLHARRLERIYRTLWRRWCRKPDGWRWRGTGT